MKEVRWICGQNAGVVSVEDLSKELQFFEALAKDVFKEGKADHVIYASKVYDKNGELDVVHFYNPVIELSDEEFEKRTNGLTDYVVYALHRR